MASEMKRAILLTVYRMDCSPAGRPSRSISLSCMGLTRRFLSRSCQVGEVQGAGAFLGLAGVGDALCVWGRIVRRTVGAG